VTSDSKIILVTGGTGNIGKAFIQAFESSYTIHAVLRNKRKVSEIALLGAEPHYLPNPDRASIFALVKNVKPDVIIANAAHVNLLASDNALDDLAESNLNMVLHYLQAAAMLPFCHVISFDSYSSYNHMSEPLYGSAYGRSKFIARELCEFYSLRSNLKSSNLVIYDVYYEFDNRPSKIFNRVIDALCSDILTPLSNCDQEISFVHMSDILYAIRLVLEDKCSRDFENFAIRGPETKKLRDYFSVLIPHPKYKNLRFGEYNDPRPSQKLIDKLTPMPPNFSPKVRFEDWLLNQIKEHGIDFRSEST
jgi:nucleoside-diphosphate-sugar epimerase